MTTGRVPALDTRLRQNVVPEPALGWLVAVDAEDPDQRGAEEYQPRGREPAADGGQKDLQRGARGVGTNLQAALDTHLRGVRGDRPRDGHAGALRMQDRAHEAREVLDARSLGHLVQRVGTRPAQLD